MQTFFSLYNRLLAWIRAGSNWRWVLGGLLLVALFVAAPLLLLRRTQDPPSADLDLEHMKRDTQIDQAANQQKDQNEKAHKEQIQKIDKDTHTASPEQLRQDTLKEVLND